MNVNGSGQSVELDGKTSKVSNRNAKKDKCVKDINGVLIKILRGYASVRRNIGVETFRHRNFRKFTLYTRVMGRFMASSSLVMITTARSSRPVLP